MALKMIREIPTVHEIKLLIGTGVRARLHDEAFVRKVQLEPEL